MRPALDIVTDLAAAHRELGDLLSREHDIKTQAFAQALPTAKFVKDAQHYADLQSVGLTREILKLRGEIAALTAEWEYMKWQSNLSSG